MMSFTFVVKNHPTLNGDTVYYYDGDNNVVRSVHNTEELKYLRSTYEDYKLRPLKHYQWDNVSYPVQARLFGTLNPTYNSTREQQLVDTIKKAVNEYITVYADPDWFVSKTLLPIRAEATRNAEVVGYANIDQRFAIKDMIFACDWYWGIIDYKGQIAYIPMQDMTGEEYGVYERRDVEYPSVQEVMDWLNELVQEGSQTSFLGYYETQSVDFINWLLSNFFANPVLSEGEKFINDSDLLGYVTYGPDKMYSAKKGDIVVVKRNGKLDKLIVESLQDTTFKVYNQLEPTDKTTIGSKVVLETVSLADIEFIGGVRLPYTANRNPKKEAGPLVKTAAKPQSKNIPQQSGKLSDRKGTFLVRATGIHVRRSPSLSGKIVDMYRYGQSLNFDSIYVGSGYLWASYVGGSGNRNYVAIGEATNTNQLRVPYGIVNYW